MPDIKVKYNNEDGDKTAVIEIDENAVGLTNFNALNDVIEAESAAGTRNFVFDMKNLQTINSSGLGILISCLKKIKSSGAKMNFVNTNEKITGIFKLTKLDNVFEI
ncbi:MAG: STAS domain-containing protein [Ignavibacteria bacterium]|nr:STAS domain-containing protein [Ignavibacteria bacterium]